jgi:hypothetical protein
MLLVGRKQGRGDKNVPHLWSGWVVLIPLLQT